MLVFLLLRRAGIVASKLVVALDLLLGENPTCREVCSQVNGAEIALERRDPTDAWSAPHSSAQVGSLG